MDLLQPKSEISIKHEIIDDCSLTDPNDAYSCNKLEQIKNNHNFYTEFQTSDDTSIKSEVLPEFVTKSDLEDINPQLPLTEEIDIKDESVAIEEADSPGNPKPQTGEKPFECQICEKAFSWKSSLQRHMNIHSGEKSISCKICNKPIQNLQLHTHAVRKPFQCKLCNKTFSRKSSLPAHMKAHSGEKAFECEICDKKFSYRITLQAHLNIHTGEKAVTCYICNKVFTRKPDLQRHMRIHTGEKPYQCKFCNLGFTYETSLQTHMKTIHKNEKRVTKNVQEEML